VITGKSGNSYVRRIAVVFIAITVISLVLSVSPKRISGDFDVYYNASRNYLAGSAVYSSHEGGIEEFKYLPLFALVFSPFAVMERIPSFYLWSFLNIFLFYFMFYFIHKLKLLSFSRGKDFLIIFFLFALTGRYIFANIRIGQVNILLSFLLVLMMYFEIKKKDFWASVCLAFSLMIKLFPLVFLGYFILRRRFKIAGYTISLMAVFLLLPSIYSGSGGNLKYLEDWLNLLKITPAQMLYSVKNYSVLAFFSWFFIARHEPYYIFDYHLITKALTLQVYLAWAASCFVLFILFFYDRIFKQERDLEPPYLDYACLFACGLLFNPFAYLNALVFLIVPYFFILRSLFYSKLNKAWLAAIGLLTLFCFVLSMANNKVFFPDNQQFHTVLKYRIPLWTIILVYLNLWLIKLSFKLRAKKVNC